MDKIFSRNSFRYPLLAIVILLAISWVYFFQGGNSSIFLLVATIFGIYMAMNIGANDVANNMGPAVGSKALTLFGAIIIAAIFEASGALIAGGDVVQTIKGGIINPDSIDSPQIFVSIMMASLLGASLWINIATFFKAPVSATHSIVGGLIGAGVTAYGVGVVEWWQIGQIGASWIISPLMGGAIAAFFMLSIRQTIFQKDERGEAAKRWVPIYVGIMVWIFATYLALKGLKQIVHINTELAIFWGAVIATLIYVPLSIYLDKKKAIFKNSKKFINNLFNVPLIFAVALLSFAHGANDVANAIGTLAAISDVIKSGELRMDNVGIPAWVMFVGAIGIAVGLLAFGGRLIKTVGNEITKLNQTRAYSVALSAAITVLIASHFGLPVSSTHIAIGGVFGIGLMREYLKKMQGKDKDYIEKSMIRNIALAWIITLPISALISSIMYYFIMKIG